MRLRSGLAALAFVPLLVGVPMCGVGQYQPPPPLIPRPAPCNGSSRLYPCGKYDFVILQNLGYPTNLGPEVWWFNINTHLYYRGPSSLFKPGPGIIFLGRWS